MSSEVFTPLQVLSVTVAIPAEQCLVLVLQSRVGEPLEADYITRQLNYLQSACAQYIHCEAAFYPEGPQPFEQASEIYQKLLQQRSENVALKGGILLGRPAEKSAGSVPYPADRCMAKAAAGGMRAGNGAGSLPAAG